MIGCIFFPFFGVFDAILMSGKLTRQVLLTDIGVHTYKGLLTAGGHKKLKFG